MRFHISDDGFGGDGDGEPRNPEIWHQGRQIHMFTDLIEDSANITWTIGNYLATARSFDIIPSPLFHAGPQLGHVWQFEVTPRQSIDGVDYFGLAINLLSYGDGQKESQLVKIEATVLNDNETEFCTVEGTDWLEENECLAWDQFQLAKDIEESCIVNGELRLNVCISIQRTQKRKDGDKDGDSPESEGKRRRVDDSDTTETRVDPSDTNGLVDMAGSKPKPNFIKSPFFSFGQK